MITDTARPMTQRQRDVMERIDRRLPIKLIAHELGVSETRINQHIRALKDIFEVHSLGDLVEAYRASRQAAEEPEALEATLRKDAYRNGELPRAAMHGNSGQWGGTDHYVFADAVQLPLDGAWHDDPQVVPGVLDGKYAVLFRLTVIIGITLASAASLILLVSAALGLSEVLGS